MQSLVSMNVLLVLIWFVLSLLTMRGHFAERQFQWNVITLRTGSKLNELIGLRAGWMRGTKVLIPAAKMIHKSVNVNVIARDSVQNRKLYASFNLFWTIELVTKVR
ncbi:MAG: hypothetical protein ACTS6H_00300 [Candidatus Hodgkinia cicadicola]